MKSASHLKIRLFLNKSKIFSAIFVFTKSIYRYVDSNVGQTIYHFPQLLCRLLAIRLKAIIIKSKHELLYTVPYDIQCNVTTLIIAIAHSK